MGSAQGDSGWRWGEGACGVQEAAGRTSSSTRHRCCQGSPAGGGRTSPRHRQQACVVYVSQRHGCFQNTQPNVQLDRGYSLRHHSPAYAFNGSHIVSGKVWRQLLCSSLAVQLRCSALCPWRRQDDVCERSEDHVAALPSSLSTLWLYAGAAVCLAAAERRRQQQRQQQWQQRQRQLGAVAGAVRAGPRFAAAAAGATAAGRLRCQAGSQPDTGGYALNRAIGDAWGGRSWTRHPAALPMSQ